jgi:hypothetical protein
MSSTGQPPGQSGPPPDAAPLSAHERDVLARLATVEYLTDPRFAGDLSAGRVREPEGRAPRWVAIVGAVLALAVVVGFAAGPWFPLAAVLALVVAVPLGLAYWASRQERHRR